MQTFTYYTTDLLGGYAGTEERSFLEHEIYNGLPPNYTGMTLISPPVTGEGMIAVLNNDGGSWTVKVNNTLEPYYLEGIDEPLYLPEYGMDYPPDALPEPPLGVYLARLDEVRAEYEEVVLLIDGIEYEYNQTTHLQKVLQSHTIKHGTVTEQTHISPDGTRHALTAEQHSAITMEFGLYEAELRNHDRALHDALVDAEDMEAVDLETGWPETTRTTAQA